MKILFKLLVSLFLVLTLAGCFTKGGVTGKQTWGQAMSPAWFGMAPKEDINYYFDKKSVSELCILWENYYPGSKGSVKIRSHISRSLERRGEDGLKCSNPSSDSKAIASKKLEDLETAPAPDAEIAVPASNESISKKVKLDLEVDTSVKDLGPNPFAKIIHLAKAVDAWRIFPRIFITTYIILLYKCVIWFMNLDNPTLEQSGLISIVVGAGAAWFGLYTSSRK